MTKYSYTHTTKYSEKDEGFRGGPKRGPKTPWGTKIVRYDHSHFV